VLVEATDKTREIIRGTYMPTAGANLLASYSVEESNAIRRLLGNNE
jgi:hypothetical protein